MYQITGEPGSPHHHLRAASWTPPPSSLAPGSKGAPGHPLCMPLGIGGYKLGVEESCNCSIWSQPMKLTGGQFRIDKRKNTAESVQATHCNWMWWLTTGLDGIEGVDKCMEEEEKTVCHDGTSTLRAREHWGLLPGEKPSCGIFAFVTCLGSSWKHLAGLCSTQNCRLHGPTSV